MGTIPDDLMGDVWPAARPGGEGADYGRVAFSPTGSFPVRSFQTFELVYTVGEYGLDDTGAIKIVQRWTGDQGPVQTADPSAPNYVTATASNGVSLVLHPERYPHRRPWYDGLRVTVERGYMRPGDTITVIYGDRAGGSPGYRLQTFCEAAFEFKVLADCCATGVFLPVGSGTVEIVGGPVERWVLAAPTLRRPGETFGVGLRGEDVWGNATVQASGRFALGADGPVEGLPETVDFPIGSRGMRIGGLSIADEGVTRFTLRNEAGEAVAVSNPVVTRADGPRGYWGDLHGQSGETVGINPMRDYLDFARDIAFLDVASHQANDFQIRAAFWEHINALTAEYDEDGRFTVFPGYEWSGNTPVGGDHNVFFRREGRPIRRSSRALLTDRTGMADDAPTLPHLLDALQGEDCVLYAHVGGRPADISVAHDPRLRTAVEVHSDWGTFEWILTDAFALGHRVGLVCNSDGHKGAPGACHPGASEFGAYSGLTCFLAESHDRDGIFDSLRARRHYGTTGCRLHLEVVADLGEGGRRWPHDPAWSDTPPKPCRTARMGDIVATDRGTVDLSVTCHAHAPIERIDILRGPDIVATRRPYAEADLGNRLRMIWQGAEYRGRGRQTRWNGSLRMSGPAIDRFARINAWNHERPFHRDGPRTIRFDAVTTGNFGGCDLWLDGAGPGRLRIETDHVSGSFDLDTVGYEDIVLPAGGLDRQVRLFRLPETLDRLDWTIATPVSLDPARDSPLWVRVTTEDGCNAWSSPIYVVPS